MYRCLALVLSGASLDRAWSVAKRASGKVAGVPYGRMLLLVTIGANAFAMCITFWNCVEWAIDQNRSFEAINSFKPSDAVASVANAIVA